MSTDCGVEGLVTNIRQLPNDDKRRRLFELATSNSGTYFSASQARIEASTYRKRKKRNRFQNHISQGVVVIG